jgi:hypothetical protein
MLRFLSAFAATVLAACAAQKPAPAPQATFVNLPNPADPAALAPQFARAPDGTVWLLWIEPAFGHAVRCAPFDAATNQWGEARTITSGPAVLPSEDDLPALTAGPNGQLTAVWPAMPAGQPPLSKASTLYVSSSTDSGRTWTAPVPLTQESTTTTLASLATLADGRVIAAWLDRRGQSPGNRVTRLYARILGSAPAQDILIEPQVSEAAAPALVAFPDGGALLTYRGRSDTEVRDLYSVRFHQGQWQPEHILNHDDWRIPRCLGEGPQLASDGGRVATAWFTGADSRSRVLLSTSPDAGARFLMPLTVDHGQPVGRPAVALLHDGAALTAWIEGQSAERRAKPAGLWLRRASPDFALDEAILLAPDAGQRPRGQPRLALVRDFTGEDAAATLLVAYTNGTSSAPGIRTLLVTVPEADLLAAANRDCNCAPTPAELLGFSLRGTVTAVDATRREITAKHTELPGLLLSGSHSFKVTPEVLASLAPGRDFLGRIEQRAGTWWLFSVRLLAAPPARK